MAATDAKPLPQKNVAYRVTFPIFDADGDLVTGAAALDSEVSKDGAAFADATNEATEIGTSGMYFLDLTAAEMNADTVVVIVKTTTSGAKTTPIVLYPEEAGDLRVNVTQVNGTNQTAGDIPALITTVDDLLDTEIAAIKAKTDNLPADPADASDIAASFSTVNTKLDTIDDFLDTEVAAIKAKTDNLPIDPADESSIQATLATIAAYVDTEIAAIKAKTDNLPIDPADESSIQATLATLAAYIDTEIAAIKAKTDNLPASPAAVGSAMTLAANAVDASALATDAVNEIRDAIFTGVMTESYAADGAAPTLAQLLFMLWSALGDFSISGTTLTCKKLDGSTTSMTFTLNDATNPTSRTRAT